MAAASLVLGIISLLISWIPFINIIGIITGVIGIVCGVMGRKNEKGRGVATGGLICSITGLSICLLSVVACGGLISAAGSIGDFNIDEMERELENMFNIFLI